MQDQCWLCKPLLRFVLQLGQHQGDFDWCLETVAAMLGKRPDGDSATLKKDHSSLLRLSKYEDAQYLQDNRLTAIDARQLWEGAKKGLALFFMNMPRSEQ